jgi:hypothetical protein
MRLNRLLSCLVLLAILPALGLLAGCRVVNGSGETDTWEMDYADFSKLDISHSFEARITRADKFLVTITIDKALNEYLTVDQRGDTLRIGLESGRVYTDTSQEVVITMPELRRLELSGSSRAWVTGFSTTDSVGYELSGASRMTLENIKSGDAAFKLSGASEVTGATVTSQADFDLSGASTIELKGSASDITIGGSGASDFMLEDFPVENARISLSGSSSAIVKLDGRMDLDLSGASEVEYIGDPRLGDMNLSGNSRVERRE